MDTDVAQETWLICLMCLFFRKSWTFSLSNSFVYGGISLINICVTQQRLLLAFPAEREHGY